MIVQYKKFYFELLRAARLREPSADELILSLAQNLRIKG